MLYEQLGLTVDDLDDDTVHQLGLEGEEGVLITDVEQGGAAWRAALRPGQVILSVNREPVSSTVAFKQALASADDDEKVLLLITDGRSSRFIVVTPDQE
jgi:serine protease Do